MQRSWTVPALFVLLTACGAEEDELIDITYDYCSPLAVVPAEDATPRERESIAAAVGMWNELGLTELSTGSGADVAQTVPLSFRSAAFAFFGLYEDETGEVLINRLIEDDRELAITIAHELGHAFGLVHVESDERVSVMNRGNLEVAPNEGDAEALRTLRRCGP